jgi:hypothetical protein
MLVFTLGFLLLLEWPGRYSATAVLEAYGDGRSPAQEFAPGLLWGGALVCMPQFSG